MYGARIMIPLNISFENSQGVTVLSNLFIDKYMEEANDVQIKVYLYLLRMVGSNLPTDISEISDKFNYPEKDVEKALKYWEKKELIGLGFCENRISSITIKDIAGANKAEAPKQSQMVVTESSSNQDIPMIKMDYEKEKAKYSIEDIQRIKADSEVKMLLGVAQEYFGLPNMNPNSIRSICFIYDRLDFSFELIDFLLERCVTDGKKNTMYLEQLAKFLYEKGIKDKEEAKREIDQIAPYYVPIVMDYIGVSGKAVPAQIELVRKWIMDYGFGMEVIKLACGKAAMSGYDDRFSYADKTLLDWKNHDIHTSAEAEAYMQKYKEEKAEKARKAEEVKAETKKTYGPQSTGTYQSGKSDFCTMKKRAYNVEELLKAAKVN